MCAAQVVLPSCCRSASGMAPPTENHSKFSVSTLPSSDVRPTVAYPCQGRLRGTSSAPVSPRSDREFIDDCRGTPRLDVLTDNHAPGREELRDRNQIVRSAKVGTIFPASISSPGRAQSTGRNVNEHWGRRPRRSTFRTTAASLRYSERCFLRSAEGMSHDPSSTASYSKSHCMLDQRQIMNVVLQKGGTI